MIAFRCEPHVPKDSHRRVTVFVNGANAGVLTVRSEELGELIGLLGRTPQAAPAVDALVGELSRPQPSLEAEDWPTMSPEAVAAAKQRYEKDPT